jgi:hypothetical protein
MRAGISMADYVVTITRAGVELREKGRRFAMLVPWSDVLKRAEHLAGEHRHREQLRNAAVRRISRAAR